MKGKVVEQCRMPRLTDPGLLARYRSALAEWKVEGYIELIGQAAEGLRTTLQGVTVKYFKEALHHHVFVEAGEIDQVKEDREGWRDKWEFHYDLRPTINGVKKCTSRQGFSRRRWEAARTLGFMSCGSSSLERRGFSCERKTNDKRPPGPSPGRVRTV
jgi:hypothetical protein